MIDVSLLLIVVAIYQYILRDTYDSGESIGWDIDLVQNYPCSDGTKSFEGETVQYPPYCPAT